ncbi:MAG: hypothetical protein RR515_00255 [Clostridium sp.]
MRCNKLNDIVNNYNDLSISYMKLLNFNEQPNCCINEMCNYIFYSFSEELKKEIKVIMPFIYNSNTKFIILYSCINEGSKDSITSYIGIQKGEVTRYIDNKYASVNSEEMSSINTVLESYNCIYTYIIWLSEIDIKDTGGRINLIKGDYVIVEIFEPLNICEIDNLIKRYEEFYINVLNIRDHEIRSTSVKRNDRLNIQENEIVSENKKSNSMEKNARVENKADWYRENENQDLPCSIEGDKCKTKQGEGYVNAWDQKENCKNEERCDIRGRGKIGSSERNENRREEKNRVNEYGRILRNVIRDIETDIDYLLIARSKGAFKCMILLFSHCRDAQYLYSMLFSNSITKSYAVKGYNVFDVSYYKDIRCLVKEIIDISPEKSRGCNITNKKFTSIIDSSIIQNKFLS